MKFDNLLFYSTNTYLAFLISETYYQGEHFVWCGPIFNPLTLGAYDLRRKTPPSSSPLKIYTTFKEDIEGNDLDSKKIKSAKNGLKNGAGIQHANKVIDDIELASILYTIDHASITEFRPLIYAIPKHLVESRVKIVPVDAKANPLSVEYQILDLKKNEFEILEF